MDFISKNTLLNEDDEEMTDYDKTDVEGEIDEKETDEEDNN